VTVCEKVQNLGPTVTQAVDVLLDFSQRSHDQCNALPLDVIPYS
jgi:hypothetical protein